MIDQSVRDEFWRRTDGMEGRKSFLYLDRLGLPTTASGCLLKTAAQALSLRWLRPDGTPATRDEIAAEWALVNEHQELAGRVAELSLKVPRGTGAGPLRLTPASLESLNQERLDATVEDLTRRYPAWETWPPQACLALLLTVWATGTASPYPKRDAALARLDFKTAAEESAIAGNAPRSAVVKALFLEAAKAADPTLSADERARTLALVASTLAASVTQAIEDGREGRDDA